MPPILFKDLLQEIRSSFGRYLSILAIVALGVSFFAGIKASAPDMKHSADAYFDKYNLQDIQLYSTIGITQDDLDALKKVSGVSEVQGQFTGDFLAHKDNREMTVKVISFTENQTINKPRLVEGRMPTSDDECLIQADSATGKLFGSWAIGETITLESGTDTPLSSDLKRDSFTIVGKAWNPNYLSYELGTSSIGSGTVDSFVYVLQDVIAADYYTEADLCVTDARALNSYSDAYFALTDPVVTRLESMADSQLEADIQKKHDTLAEKEDEARQKLDEAKQKLDEAAEKIASGNVELSSRQKEIADGEAQLKSGQEKLAASKSEWESGKKQLEAGFQQVNDATAQIHSAQARLPELQKQKEQLEQAITAIQALNAAEKSLQDAQAALDTLNTQISQLEANQPQNPRLIELKARKVLLEESVKAVLRTVTLSGVTSGTSISEALNAIASQKQQLLSQVGGSLESAKSLQKQADEGIEQINSASSRLAELDQTRSALDEKRLQLETAKDQIDQGENELKENEAKLADGRKQIEEAKSKLAEAQSEYNKGLQEFNEQKTTTESQLAEARKTIDELDPEWIILDRNSHYSYRDYESCADRMDGIASIFPVFFFLVAALVCMTTMTRMVDEDRNEMGTLKALGYFQKQIAMKYLLYAGSASIFGSIIGCAVGMVVFPMIIYSSWNIMYNLEGIQFAFQPGLMLLASGSVTGVVLLATWFSIYREMREVPAQLMRPKAAKAGQRILLEHIPWFWSRLSFMHKVSLRNLFRYKKRFFMTVIGISGCSALLLAGFGLNDSLSDIVPRQFEAVYHFNATLSAETDDPQKLVEAIDKIPGVKDCFDLEILPVTVNYDGKDVSASLNIVSDPKAFDSFMTFYPMSRESSDHLSDEGAMVSVKTAEKLGIKAGDTMTFKTTGNQEVSVRVSGIFEQYTGHQIYVTKNTFDAVNIQEKPDTSILLVNEQNDAAFENGLGSRLMDLDGVRSVTFYSATVDNFQNMISSIKLVVVVLVLSAAMLAFVVLYNLSNVNISERLREIATIKVLGFTEKEVNAYVNRETIILALIGSAAGLLLGIYLHDMIMNLAELDTIRFGRTIFWQSYLYSTGLTMLFTLLVNWIMKFRLRKIQMVESLKAVE